MSEPTNIYAPYNQPLVDEVHRAAAEFNRAFTAALDAGLDVEASIEHVGMMFNGIDYHALRVNVAVPRQIINPSTDTTE